MARSVWLVLTLAVLGAAGCVPKEMLQEFIGEPASTPLVPARVGEDKPAQASPAPAILASYAPAKGEVAMQVDFLGRKILTANPQAGLKPLFITIGAPQAEVFHRGTHELYITEGLVKQCKTEGQLAAVLCQEIGKMVSEREALASAQTRKPDRGPPPDVPYSNPGHPGGGADEVRAAELAKFGPKRPLGARPLPPPDPKGLARHYLKQAGYPESDLDAVAPLLKGAHANFGLEKQMKAGGSAPAWGPAR